MNSRLQSARRTHACIQNWDVSHSRANVVVIDEEFPYPENSGKRIRTFNLMRRLAGEFDITFVAHQNADENEAGLARRRLNELGIRTVEVCRKAPPKKGIGFYYRLAANLFSPLPYSVASHCSSEMRSVIKQMMDQDAADLWHCEWTPYTKLFEDLNADPLVVAAHNIESLIWRRYCETESNPVNRWYIQRQRKKFEHFERWAFSRATRTITVSQADASLARSSFGARGVEVVENGVDLRRYASSANARNAKKLIFVGGLDWRPNLDGIQCFLKTAFPAIVDADPDITLEIVGRNAPPWLIELVARNPSITLQSNVPDVIPHLSSAGIMVVPLRVGGGSRLKIIEAAANGLPVVSTRIGAEGLGLSHREHYLATERVDEMCVTVLGAIRDYEACQAMAVRAREFVEAQHDWDVLAKRQAAVWQAALCQRN